MARGIVVKAPTARSALPAAFCCSGVRRLANKRPIPIPSATRVPAINPMTGKVICLCCLMVFLRVVTTHNSPSINRQSPCPAPRDILTASTHLLPYCAPVLLLLGEADTQCAGGISCDLSVLACKGGSGGHLPRSLIAWVWRRNCHGCLTFYRHL
jgi:hypothetical protein